MVGINVFACGRHSAADKDMQLIVLVNGNNPLVQMTACKFQLEDLIAHCFG